MNRKIAYGLVVVIILIATVAVYSITRKNLITFPQIYTPVSTPKLGVIASTSTNISRNMSGPQVGKECTENEESYYMNANKRTNGLQCFFYYTDPKTTWQSEKGIWIYPESYVTTSLTVNYAKYITNFATFSNEDFSFQYPIGSKITDTWQQNGSMVISIDDGAEPAVGRYYSNDVYITLQQGDFDQASFISQNSSIASLLPFCNASACWGLWAIPIDSHGPAKEYLIYPENGQYIQVTADQNAGFLTEVLLQSIQFK